MNIKNFIKSKKYTHQLSFLTERLQKVTNKKIILVENPSIAKKLVQTGKLSQEDYNLLISFDPTSQKKYLGWLAKVWIKDTPNADDLRNSIEEFDTLSKKGKTKTKDINAFKSFNDLVTELRTLNDSGDNLSLKELENDYEVIIDNSDLLIITPHTHEASRKLGITKFAFRDCIDEKGQRTGKDSAWCTTYKAPDHFDDYYYNRNVTFYYIRILSDRLLMKIKEAFPNRYKELVVVALAVLDDGQIDGYDGLDKNLNKQQINTFCSIIGIS